MALSEAPFTRTCIWILSHQALFCSFHFFMASSSLVWRGKKPQNVEPLFLAQLKSKFTIIKARFTCKLVIRVEISAKSIECFHSRGQHLRQFIGTKESAYIRKELDSQGLVWNTNMAALTSRENTLSCWSRKNDTMVVLTSQDPHRWPFYCDDVLMQNRRF